VVVVVVVVVALVGLLLAAVSFGRTVGTILRVLVFNN